MFKSGTERFMQPVVGSAITHTMSAKEQHEVEQLGKELSRLSNAAQAKLEPPYLPQVGKSPVLIPFDSHAPRVTKEFKPKLETPGPG